MIEGLIEVILHQQERGVILLDLGLDILKRPELAGRVAELGYEDGGAGSAVRVEDLHVGELIGTNRDNKGNVGHVRTNAVIVVVVAGREGGSRSAEESRIRPHPNLEFKDRRNTVVNEEDIVTRVDGRLVDGLEHGGAEGVGRVLGNQDSVDGNGEGQVQNTLTVQRCVVQDRVGHVICDVPVRALEAEGALRRLSQLDVGRRWRAEAGGVGKAVVAEVDGGVAVDQVLTRRGDDQEAVATVSPVLGSVVDGLL